MIKQPPVSVSEDKNGTPIAILSLVVCLLAPIATLMVTLPDRYLRLDGEGEGVFAVFLLSPYVVLASFAWWQHRSRRNSVAILVLTLLIVVFGLWGLAGESAGYRAALAENPRGPDYIRDRYQRMDLFIVPVLQWLACLAIGWALFVESCWKRIRRPDGVSERPPLH